jgi:hypothetical protein
LIYYIIFFFSFSGIDSIITLLICAAFTCIGEIDIVTPYISLTFFFIYASMNVVAFILLFNKTPNFRPKFTKFNMVTCILGALSCVVIMAVCSWYAAIGFVNVCSSLYLFLGLAAVAYLLYKYIEYTGVKKNWGDSIKGFQFQSAKNAILSLEDYPAHSKNWRPQLLVCVKMGF